jgi:hypothetical protein
VDAMSETKVERGARATKQILPLFTQVPSKKACSRKFVPSNHGSVLSNGCCKAWQTLVL